MHICVLHDSSSNNKYQNSYLAWDSQLTWAWEDGGHSKIRAFGQGLEEGDLSAFNKKGKRRVKDGLLGCPWKELDIYHIS